MQHEHNGSVAAVAAAVVAFTDLESVDCVKIVAFGEVVGGTMRGCCVDHTQATMTTFTSEENETDERRRRTRNLT